MLVALRLVIGWHFYKEGAKKKANPNFSSAGLLSIAKGPLADTFHSFVPELHDWNTLVATPRELKPLTDEQTQEIATWQLEREKMLGEWKASVSQWKKDRKAKKEGTPAEAPKAPTPDKYKYQPHASYQAWAEKIGTDWRAAQKEFVGRVSLTEEQKAASADALDNQLHLLRDYFEGVPKKFEGQDLSLAEYQHELWRLEQLKKKFDIEQSTGRVPYLNERIAQKKGDARGKLGPWKSDIVGMEQSLLADWSAGLEESETKKISDLLEPEGSATMRKIDTLVTYLTLGVGACLILGLFTRVAAVVGAGFLFSVILSQPPWVEGAIIDVFYYQAVELTAMLLLAAVGAGRWAGLDFFLGSACGKCCRSKGTK